MHKYTACSIMRSCGGLRPVCHSMTDHSLLRALVAAENWNFLDRVLTYNYHVVKESNGWYALDMSHLFHTRKNNIMRVVRMKTSTMRGLIWACYIRVFMMHVRKHKYTINRYVHVKFLRLIICISSYWERIAKRTRISRANLNWKRDTSGQRLCVCDGRNQATLQR